MTGTRGGPPGRSAENWSRTDGIRAGAVSGPWRSVPRTDQPADNPGERPQPIRNGAPQARPAPAPPLAWTGKGAAAPPVSVLHEPVGRGAARARSGGGPGLAAWVGFGFLLAAAIVAAAVILRPTAEQPATEPAAGAVPTPEATAATRESGLVRLRIGSDFPTERRAEIVAALEAAGLPPVQVEALPFRIMTSRVGYYRAEDREAAEKLAQLVQPVVGDAAGEVVLRDYAELLSDAEPGRLDLWVGN